MGLFSNAYDEELASLVLSSTHFVSFIVSYLNNKVGHHPPIISVHPWPIGVEYPGDSHLDTGLLVVGVGQGLRHPLALVITGPRTNGVNIAPVGLWLWMHLGISINLENKKVSNEFISVKIYLTR